MLGPSEEFVTVYGDVHGQFICSVLILTLPGLPKQLCLSFKFSRTAFDEEAELELNKERREGIRGAEEPG